MLLAIHQDPQYRLSNSFRGFIYPGQVEDVMEEKSLEESTEDEVLITLRC
jgi:hypothetical protein